MLAREQLDAVFIATPSKLHARMVGKALERGLHVFCEKPFVLDVATASAWSQLAESKQLVTQVGYHFRFVGAFQEAARIVRSGALGTRAPRARRGLRPGGAAPQGQHLALGEDRRRRRAVRLRLPRDRLCELRRRRAGVGRAASFASGIFSRDVDDEVYCTLHYARRRERPAVRQLERRELSQDVRPRSSVWGTNGRIMADRQECQIYLREAASRAARLRGRAGPSATRPI